MKSILLLFVAIICNGQVMQQAVVNSTNSAASGAPTIVQSYAHDNTACNGINTDSAICSGAWSSTTGNVIHVTGAVSSGGSIVVSDTALNTYNCETPVTTGVTTVTSCYAKNITGNASNVIKFDGTTINGCGLTTCGIVVYEIAGASPSAPLDVHQSATTTVGVGTPCLSGSFSTSTANEVITISCFTGYDGNTFSAGAITGTNGTLIASNNDVIAGESRAVTSTQSGTAQIGRSAGQPASANFVMSYK